MRPNRLGICALPNQISAAADAGFDYVEMDLNRILCMGEAAYREMAAVMQDRNIYAEVVSGMLPAGVSIVGENVSAQALHHALDRSFETARALGAELIIFDCPDARRLPPDFDPAMAWRQLGNLVRILQSYAVNFNIRTALLPLRRGAADLMNYVSEATLISAILRLDRIGVAASSYNMAMEAESLSSLKRTGSLLWHMRVSNAIGCRLPKAGDREDYVGIFRALRDIGYSGRISCEGDCLSFAPAAKSAFECIQTAYKLVHP